MAVTFPAHTAGTASLCSLAARTGISGRRHCVFSCSLGAVTMQCGLSPTRTSRFLCAHAITRSTHHFCCICSQRWIFIGNQSCVQESGVTDAANHARARCQQCGPGCSLTLRLQMIMRIMQSNAASLFLAHLQPLSSRSLFPASICPIVHNIHGYCEP